MNKIEKKHHALIIEDDRTYHRMIATDLKSLHHSFDIVSTQVEAEEKLQSDLYCYVILDLEIPYEKNSDAHRKYGKNVAGFIRDQLDGKKPAVLLLSSFADTKTTAVFMGDSLSAWSVIKDNYEDDFIDGVEEVLNRSCRKLGCPGKVKSERPSEDIINSGVTAGEFFLKSDRVDLRLTNGELIEKVIEKQHTRTKNNISRPFLFILAIADDNSKKEKGKLDSSDIYDRFEELDEDDKMITVTEVSVYANSFRDSIDQVLEKAGYKLNRDSLLPNARTAGGYQLGDGFFVTKVEND